ncbi:hypothetical protein [Paenibacillus sp. MBLB4367]|uniref:hypothetical protein n=1 Tax=Paenibacillus sp. MBLB4367 TaxID=3384767 RepID=UPI00390810D8
MKSINKKMMLVSLSTTLAAGTLLAACGGKDSGTTGASGSPSGSASTSPSAAPVNKNINILLSNAGAKYPQEMKEDDKYIKELSKQSGYNLKFDFLNHPEYKQQLTVRFASGDLPDLIRTDSITDSAHPGAVEQGVFKELGPLIDKYGPNIKKKIPQQAWDSPSVSKDGKIYAIPALAQFMSNRVMYIRQDWLDKLGMKQPKTLDEWVKYFEAIKGKDLNGDGDPNNEYGFYVRENMIYGDVFFSEFGAHPGMWYNVNGTMTPGMIKPEMKEAIKFWKMMYDKGYVNPNLFTNKGADWVAGIKKGQAGSWKYDITSYPTTWTPSNFVNQSNVKIDVVGAPQGPKGGGLETENSQINFVWVIPNKSKQAEEVIKFLNWAWSDEAENFFSFGIKGTNYTEEAGKIKWDPKADVNNESGPAGSSTFYQLIINPRGDGRMSSKLIDINPESEMLKKGVKIASENILKNDGLFMPSLQSLATKPELSIGFQAGNMFLDMFAKAVTGKEDVDKAFDTFVAEWKKRGGEAAMKEATNWYNNKKKK